MENISLSLRTSMMRETLIYKDFPMPPEFEDSGWKLFYSPDGRLCQLSQGLRCWMGNGPDEQTDMADSAVRLHGNCLVLGLGIGLIVQHLDHLKKCKSITVVEKSPIVIKNISNWLRSQITTPLEIICDDDEKFLEKTDGKWDTMFADTWELCTDALEKIERLKVLAKGKIRGKKIYWAEWKLKIMKKYKCWEDSRQAEVHGYC